MNDLALSGKGIKLVTSLRVILQVCLRSGPSLLKCWCGLSRMIKTISAGILFGAWSPSRWNVILVPDFQPGFTLMVRTFSSFFAVPSFATTRLDIFIRLVTPWNRWIVRTIGCPKWETALSPINSSEIKQNSGMWLAHPYIRAGMKFQ